MSRMMTTLSIAVVLFMVLFANAFAYDQPPQAPVPFPRMGPIQASGMEKPGAGLDDWVDSLIYDDGIPNQWYGGLNDFTLATWFQSPVGPSAFELRQIQFMLVGEGEVTVSVCENNGGVPGTVSWSSTVMDVAGLNWTTVEVTGLEPFPADTIFWITIHSNGPPYEAFDAESVEPPHSIFYYEPWGTQWFQSPGDNFIRAFGAYSGGFNLSVIDVSHAGNFFNLNLNPANVTFTSTISNDPDGPGIEAGDATVYYRILDEFGALLMEEFEDLPGMEPGDVIEVPHTFSIGDDGNYIFECEVSWQWDQFDADNVGQIEFQVYTPPTAWLRYDSDPYLGATYTYNLGDGFAMRFDPNLNGLTYTISQIEIENVVVEAGHNATVQVLADDNGVPGEVLWEMSVEPEDGWNVYDVENVENVGAFYIAYLFDELNTPLLCFDGLMRSGQAWMYTGDAWVADPLAYDWCMRGKVDLPPNLSITDLTITNPVPPYIGPTGGTLTFDVEGQNNSPTPITFDIWADVTWPDGTNHDSELLDPDYYLPGFGSLTETYTKVIPETYPPRRHTLNVYFGDWDTEEVYASAGTFFYKTIEPGGGMALLHGTTTSSFNIIPDEFSLDQNYPNPFNPTTSIRFGLPTESEVHLAVYDLQGRLVIDLFNGNLRAGIHQFTFDASSLSSGVYIYRLQAGDFNATQKMILMK